jgi:hypothetical protein
MRAIFYKIVLFFAWHFYNLFGRRKRKPVKRLPQNVFIAPGEILIIDGHQYSVIGTDDDVVWCNKNTPFNQKILCLPMDTAVKCRTGFVIFGAEVIN